MISAYDAGGDYLMFRLLNHTKEYSIAQETFKIKNEFVIRLTKNWFTRLLEKIMFEYQISLYSALKTLYSSFMFTVAQGMAKVNSILKLLTLNPMFKHLKRGRASKRNKMKNVATEFAVEGGVLKRRENLQQLYINLYTKVFIPTSLVFEVVLSFGDVQERIIRHFGISISKIYTFASDELIECA
ncbi:unnamed protein product [Rhizophagus irregularis]|nr:unnamed protein product [Rhizophagus irregularis]CAB4426642.1 unnamed protein product [Rhizophagus irregularis]